MRLDLGATSDIPETWAPEPGAAQRRDAALDADARQGMVAPLPPADNASEREAYEALGLPAMVEGACETCRGAGFVIADQADNGLIVGFRLCPGCNGTRVSER